MKVKATRLTHPLGSAETGRRLLPTQTSPKPAEVRRRKRQEREQRAEELKALASLSPRERLRLELPHHHATVLERLAEILNGPDPEVALNQFWKAWIRQTPLARVWT